MSSCSEFNLPTFAFLYPNSASDPSSHALTWFLPTGAEQVLCGHGTLGAASILTTLPAMHDFRSFDLDTPLAGSLRAKKAEDGQLQLDLPADDVQALEGAEREKVTEAALKAIGGQGQVKGVWRGRLDVCIEFEMNQGVKLGDVPVDHSCLVSRPPPALRAKRHVDIPSQVGLSGRGVTLTTATGNTEGPRFHSRQFFPGGVEDSVCGSAHLLLGVIWAPRFDAVGKPLLASQGGKRQGEITVVWDGKEGKDGGRMKLRGKCIIGKKDGIVLHAQMQY
jgi:predicted PhzF superfamily epimerase YddE/YHI9